MPFHPHISPKLGISLLVCALVGSCDKCSTTTTNEGNFAIAASDSECSIEAGASESMTITVTRSGGFTNAVNLAAQGLPTGVTATFTPATVPAGSTSSTFSLIVASGASPGVHSITIVGSASGMTNRQVAMVMTITAAPVGGFTISMNPPAVSIQQGQTGIAAVTVARTAPFAGAVNLALDGAPTGVTAAFNPGPIPAGSTTATATITVAASVTPGVYPLNVHGAATGGVTDRLAPLSLTVTAIPPPIPINLSCNTEATAIWLGFQDGDGPWQQIVGVNGTYSVGFTASRGAIAYVRSITGTVTTYDVALVYATRAEFVEWAPLACAMWQPHKALTGTVSGVAAGDYFHVAVGDGEAQIFPGGGSNFMISRATTGARDLVAGRLHTNLPVQPADLIIRRGTDYPAGSAIPVLDFASGEPFAAELKTATIVGAAGEVTNLWSDLITANQTSGYLPTAVPSSSLAPFPTVPSARMVAGDVHNLWASATSPDGASRREVVNTFVVPGDQTLTLGGRLTEPTVFTLTAAPFYQVRVTTTLQSEYSAVYEGSYVQPDRTGSFLVTAGWLGGTAVNLTTPDLTAVPGWLATWGPRPGVNTTLIAKGVGVTGAGGSLAPLLGKGITIGGVVMRMAMLSKQVVP